MMLFHLTTVYKDDNGIEVNKFGEPFTVKEEGLKRSRSHPVYLTPLLYRAITHAASNRNGAAKILVYAVESEHVPRVREEGRAVWTSEHVPVNAIKDTIQLQATEEITYRDIRYLIENAGKQRGWM